MENFKSRLKEYIANNVENLKKNQQEFEKIKVIIDNGMKYLEESEKVLEREN